MIMEREGGVMRQESEGKRVYGSESASESESKKKRRLGTKGEKSISSVVDHHAARWPPQTTESLANKSTPAWNPSSQ